MKSSKKERECVDRREERKERKKQLMSNSWFFGGNIRTMCMHMYACGCEIAIANMGSTRDEIYQFVAFSIISSIWMPKTQLQWPFSIRKTSICFLLIKHRTHTPDEWRLLSWHAKAHTHINVHILRAEHYGERALCEQVNMPPCILCGRQSNLLAENVAHIHWNNFLLHDPWSEN